MTGEEPFQPVDPMCVTNPTAQNSYMHQGCFDKINSLLSNEIDVIIGVVVCVAAVELLAVVFAFCLCRAAGKEQDYNNHYKY